MPEIITDKNLSADVTSLLQTTVDKSEALVNLQKKIKEISRVQKEIEEEAETLNDLDTKLLVVVRDINQKLKARGL